MIATTMEMSKRLLDGGVNPESADMAWVWRKVYDQNGVEDKWVLAVGCFKLYGSIEDGPALPAWSLSALWGLASEKGLVLEFNTKEDTAEGIIDILVDCLVDPIIKIMDDLKDGKI